jgi:O-antigen ligase
VKRFLEWGLILVIVGAVLAFGGVQPLSYLLMEVCVFALLLVALIAQVRQGKVDLPIPLAMLPIIFLVLLQTVPLPAHWVVWCSPARLFPALGSTPQHAGDGWRTLSIDPHQTWQALGKLLAYCGAFVLAALVFDSSRRRSTLVRALITLGCLEAAYGMFQYLQGYQKIFTYSKVFYTADATGTYINRNHYAGFLELIIPLLIAALFYSFQSWSRWRRSGARAAASGEAGAGGFQPLFFIFLLAIATVGLLFSTSRGGILACLLSIMFMVLLGLLKIDKKAWMAGTVLFLFVVVGYGTWIGLGPVLTRFEQLGEPGEIQREGRLEIWEGAFHLMHGYPIAGTGLGTFGEVYRRYQTYQVTGYVDHAHNDYVEFASETGIVGAAFLFIPIFYLLGKMIFSFMDEPRRFARAVTLGCIGSVLALLIHSMTDFNLQIPANALIFAVVLGIGYKVVCLEPRAMRRGAESRDLA